MPLDQDSIRQLAANPPPPKIHFRNAGDANDAIAELEHELASRGVTLPDGPSRTRWDAVKANARYKILRDLWAGSAAQPAAQPAPLPAAPVTLSMPGARAATPSLAKLRELEAHVFGSNSIGTFDGDVAAQTDALTKLFYSRNLIVPGLDYAALTATGETRDRNVGANRMTRALAQARVDKFFAESPARNARAKKVSGLKGRERFIAAAQEI